MGYIVTIFLKIYKKNLLWLPLRPKETNVKTWKSSYNCTWSGGGSGSQPLIVQKYLQWVSYVSVVTNVCHFVVEVWIILAGNHNVIIHSLLRSFTVGIAGCFLRINRPSQLTSFSTINSRLSEFQQTDTSSIYWPTLWEFFLEKTAPWFNPRTWPGKK